MRGKQRNRGSQPKRKSTPMHKADKFSRNNKFIQRSRQMEKSYTTQTQFQKATTSDNINMCVDLLPSIKEDGNTCYEQLVDQYSTANTALEVKGDNAIILTANTKDPDSDQDESNTSNLKPCNSFTKRFDFELSSDDITDLISNERNIYKFKWSEIGDFRVEIPMLKSLNDTNVNYNRPRIATKPADLQVLEVKSQLCQNVIYPLSALQMQVFHCANNYLDVYYPRRTHDNAEEIRYAYCLHVVNHMLKSRLLILRNNEKIAGLAKDPNLSSSEVSIPDALRDQGLTRMKVLIILPFRESALKTVQNIGNLIFANHKDKKNGLPIARYERFINDFSGDTIYFPKTNPKPRDYEQTFAGNTDDNFKIGIRFTKKTMSLYSDISSSDILIASPLALRMIINDKEQDFDFLNSIELLVIDQAELFMAQNWENLLYVLDHLHLQPQKLPETNCQRVRSYCLNGTSRFYRQTLFFASHELPEFRGLLNNKCHNYQGRVRITNQIQVGDISNVVTPIEQVFQRIDCSSVESAFDDRFQYFVRYILPQFTRSGQSHCLLYVPSYFDYVRLRNHFKNEMVNYVQISEYTKKEKISRARDIFFHSGAQFMLYSERAHFFRRTRIKGVRNLIFYQPPNFPNFYSELINLMLETNQNPRDGLQNVMNVKILFTKYDVLSLSNIVGNENAMKVISGLSDSYSFSNNE
ncbi:U3 small nucleolar RNA-associated protein 25 homolog [Drosophila sulfurigaster albostrigata]|uniref:U3 small nucleolar RNA-associated protein 25 homolog n=1 Tax=Drosophila sulfurigaster albostrigata TaxID=89887 RepID=UPI002D219093|nr:U3 small nucleolar RNA-associated protein 25 homolog [Drosophila sulfurigaster albostrigata]